MILDSLEIKYETIDVTEPEHEKEKELMQAVCKKRDQTVALPPQLFNDDTYCGVSKLSEMRLIIGFDY